MNPFRRQPAGPEPIPRRTLYNKADLEFITRRHFDVSYELGWLGSPDWQRFDAHAFARGYIVDRCEWDEKDHGPGPDIFVTLRRMSDDATLRYDLTIPNGIASPLRVWSDIDEQFRERERLQQERAAADPLKGTYQYRVTAIDHRTGEEVPVTVSAADDAKYQRAFWYAKKLYLLPAEVEQIPPWLDKFLQEALP